MVACGLSTSKPPAVRQEARVTASVLLAETPQTFVALTETFPATAPQLANMDEVPCPEVTLPPAGRVHVYPSPAVLVTLYARLVALGQTDAKERHEAGTRYFRALTLSWTKLEVRLT